MSKLITYDQGFSVPLGGVIDYKYDTPNDNKYYALTSYAEYIVRNSNQVKIRYVLEMED
jgi:hypothetical protein